ncbi:MAG: FAD-dependent thymidylate synthase [Nocardioides sp.]|uniref:FAD-dependent thymidylate synthase n=1 Tax=Nocardioides sp. TaxID=35761 RepID=UPI0039E3E058
MDAPYARVIADSSYATEAGPGVRLTTMEVCFHRFVLSEFNTHRVFSRNSASSRAIPIHKQLAKLTEDLAVPLAWPTEQPGMQGGTDLDADAAGAAEAEWRQLASITINAAAELKHLQVHKSVVNRVLEPYMWHTVVVTSTAWSNFFAQRSSPLAQPEIRAVSELMEAAYAASTPTELATGQWHLPYVQDDEHPATDGTDGTGGTGTAGWRELARVSAARCARTSYLTQAGVRDRTKDLALYDRLVTARPAHWSPLEHVATPWPENRAAGSLGFTDLDGVELSVATDHLPRVGNLLGWRSLRTEVETAQRAVTFS